MALGRFTSRAGGGPGALLLSFPQSQVAVLWDMG